jgi:mannose-6-phosphate isomerase-like protein (cupin superfamily)
MNFQPGTVVVVTCVVGAIERMKGHTMPHLNHSVAVSLPGEGESLSVSGSLFLKVSSEETGGAYSLLELRLGPGQGAPMHVHEREDEVLCVTSGQCEIGDARGRQLAPTGSSVRLPRGTPHSFRNPGPEPCHLPIAAIPGGLEHYFSDVNDAIANGQGTPERLAQIGRVHGIEFLAA